MIPYNIPYSSFEELEILKDIYANRKFSGNGFYTDLVNKLLLNIHCVSNSMFDMKSILTTSCTDALEMSALLFDIQPGDEVILPSYTFVSTALPFEMRGAKLIFADSELERPHLSIASVKKLITPKTKVIIAVNYAGIGCSLNELRNLAIQKNIFLLEDNAQGINSFYDGYHLGTFGKISTLSFHETKNINCGEGGALILTDPSLYERALVLKDKGTNRNAFQLGLVDKYSWVDIGSSFLLSEILAGHLYSQLLHIDKVTTKRKEIFYRYLEELNFLKSFGCMLPIVNKKYETNGHIFYIVMTSEKERTEFIKFMNEKQIMCIPHYVSLHSSPYFINKYHGDELVNCDKFSSCLVRLPLFYDLSYKQQSYIINSIKEYFGV